MHGCLRTHFEADMKLLCILYLLACCLAGSQANPEGAPVEACDDRLPQSPHSNSSQANPGPYTIDLSNTELLNPNSNSYEYIPGEKYTSKLSQ